MSPSSERMNKALELNAIPSEPFSSLPGLSISPFGLVYIPLPEPHQAYCLTNYLSSMSAETQSPLAAPGLTSDAPTSELENSSTSKLDYAETNGLVSDAVDMNRIMQIPSVRDVLALFLAGGEMSEGIASERIRKSLEARAGWCLPVIRLTEDVLHDPMPELLGTVTFSRYTYMSLGVERAKALSASDRGKGDREVTWSYGCWLDPAHGGKGIMTGACRYIIQNYFVTHLYTFPGQLVSGYLASNVPSSKLQAKLGFKLVAKSYWLTEVRQSKGLDVGKDKEKWKSACCVWQGFNGEKDADKEHSVYRDLDDWGE